MKKTGFAYVSAIVIIVLLISFSQIAIQLTLSQESITRDLATTLSKQELRSQRILRNSLLLLAANPTDKSFNPLQIDPSKQLSADLAFLEQTQRDLTDNSQVSDQMKALQPDVQAMDKAGHQMLVDKAKGDKKDLVKQLTPIFVHEQAYLSGTFAAYTALTGQADSLVSRVQWLEISIYVISLAVIAYEVFGVVLRAEKDRMSEITDLKAQVGILQEAMGAKRASANEGGTA